MLHEQLFYAIFAPLLITNKIITQYGNLQTLCNRH